MKMYERDKAYIGKASTLMKEDEVGAL